MSVIQKMSKRAFEDAYLKELIHKLETNYSHKFFDLSYKFTLSETEINHLLRFSDILSRSNEEEHRDISLKIISLLVELEEVKNTKYFRIIAINTLIKLGNFPSLSIINDKKDFEGIDEMKIDEIRNDYILKTVFQNSPSNHTFTDSQYKVFEEIKLRKYYSFSGSTSFGKSFIFEEFTKYIIEKDSKTSNIAFIVPTKALINQVGNRLRKLTSEFGYKVITTSIIPKIFLNQDNRYIFVFTQERLISYFKEKDNPKIKYLFVDEAHKLLNDKDDRTPLLYHSLELAKIDNINIYFASPNIPNVDIFLKMINKSEEKSKYIKESPVTQNRFFIDTISDNSCMIPTFGEDIDLPKFNFGNDEIANLKIVLNTFSKNRQSIIYCNSVYITINTAIKFADCIDDVDSDKIKEAIDLIDKKIHDKYFLKKCLKKGIAYHFGGMPEEIKAKIEELYNEEEIKFLFCTSTLLEGVDFPAKNIFILSERIGQSNMKDIDFWNLAGRAGRLGKDISGNIYCVNLYNKKGYLKSSENIKSILRNKKIKKIEPQILSKKGKFYENITNYFEKKEYTRKDIKSKEKKILEMYGNILLFHDLMNNNSILKDKYIDINKNSEFSLQKFSTSLKVPKEILMSSIGINIEIQNKIAILDVPPLPKTTTYDDCKKVLDILYEQYKWKDTEGEGREPMFRPKSNHENRLKYYAILMNSWINSKPLKIIIQEAINFYYNDGNERNIFIQVDTGKKQVKFDKQNERHINYIIDNVINDLVNILQFKIKNYISNYQALLKNKNISESSDWESFIEYGTINKRIIEIQNLGFPRDLAIFLRKNYSYIFQKNENGMICDIDKEHLFKVIDKEKYKHEFKELARFMNWNINEE